METTNGEFNVLQGNKDTNREGVNEHLINSRNNELEELRKDPELQEITEGPLFDFAIEAKNELIKRNKELGISTPDRKIALFLASEKWWIKHGNDPAISFGTINPDASSIIVSDYKAAIVNLGNGSEFRLFNQMITVGHEIYHLMPPENYILESSNDQRQVNVWRKGIVFFENKVRPSLEEGMAVLWEKRINEMVSKKFRKEYRNIARGGYPDSRSLCQFLIENIPGFETLVEKARIEGKVDVLAIAVEDKFGIGTFGELVKTAEDNAFDFQNELRSRLPREPITFGRQKVLK